jgi:hypothetical protein
MRAATVAAAPTGGQGSRSRLPRLPRLPHLPDGSRSVQSVWVWRGFLFMSFIALGLCLIFAAAGLLFYAVAWAVITAGWFATSMWLWRQHVRWDDATWAEQQRAARRTTKR